jgi:hypothetical protein
MSVANFCSSHCVAGCPVVVVFCSKQLIVVTCLLAVTYAKICIGFDWAKMFNCTLEGAGDPATMVLEATSILIHRGDKKHLKYIEANLKLHLHSRNARSIFWL